MRFIIATNHAWGNFRDAQTTVQSEEIRRMRGSVRDDARQFHAGKTQRHREREKQCTLEITAKSCRAVRRKRRQ